MAAESWLAKTFAEHVPDEKPNVSGAAYWNAADLLPRFAKVLQAILAVLGVRC